MPENEPDVNDSLPVPDSPHDPKVYIICRNNIYILGCNVRTCSNIYEEGSWFGFVVIGVSTARSHFGFRSERRERRRLSCHS